METWQTSYTVKYQQNNFFFKLSQAHVEVELQTLKMPGPLISTPRCVRQALTVFLSLYQQLRRTCGQGHTPEPAASGAA